MMNWRTIALVNCSFPIFGFIAMYFVPNSPHWLAIKGRMIQAEHAMAWLRGWITPQCIQQKFSTLKEIHHNPDKNLVTNLSNQKNISDSRTCLNLKDTLRPYLQRSFCRPLASACCIFVLYTFTGSLAIVTYIIIIFEMIGKRRLVFTSMTGTMSYLTISIVVFLVSQNHISTVQSALTRLFTC
ncbi:facilitated trehalose transporter Tret1-2 homolog [Nasonia vitripennis]|uniref:Major facilitator superfamily (MFS) profile domain-containing protein n=1 Tax=Nasonia vitripennis TaxID=7425 RepID=A0A7M7IWZ8_NASVI|nr:facilitated trehalose transporter Tret1-2 homolog [Nasonia vitripennis]